MLVLGTGTSAVSSSYVIQVKIYRIGEIIVDTMVDSTNGLSLGFFQMGRTSYEA